MKSTSALKLLVLVIVSLALSSCDSLSLNNDWPDIYGSVWKSRDGNIELDIDERQTIVTVPGAAAYFSITVDNKTYQGYFPISNMFGGTDEPLSYVLTNHTDDSYGEMILLKKKGKDNITVQFTGPIEIASVQLNRVKD